MGVRGLAEEFRLQVEPLQDILGHAQDRINRLDLLISEKGETCDSEQSVERIHLQRWRWRVNENRRATPIRTGVVMTHCTRASQHRCEGEPLCQGVV